MACKSMFVSVSALGKPREAGEESETSRTRGCRFED